MAAVYSDLFSVVETMHPRPGRAGYFHFKLHPVSYAKTKEAKAKAAEDMLLLQGALQVICEGKGERRSVILDCSALSCAKTISKLKDLIGEMEKLGNFGLDQFIIVTSSLVLKFFASGIISAKKAQSYSKIASNLQEAILLL